jgi:Tfp pilus assembly protein PilN
MSNRILSIDIRKQGVCAALVRTGLKGNRLEDYRFLSFADAPADASGPEDRLAWAIGMIAGELPVSGTACLVSIPPSEVSFRNLQVPFKDTRKIRQVLAFELEPTLPYEIDELEVDFIQVRQTEQTDLIVAAVETRRLSFIKEVLKRYDLRPGVITIGAAATALCLARFCDEIKGNFLLLDMDGSSVTACIVVDAKIFLIRTLRAGSSKDPAVLAKGVSAGVIRMLAAFDSVYDMDPELGIVMVSGADDVQDEFLKSLAADLELEVRFVDVAADTSLYISSSDSVLPGPLANNAVSLTGIETSGIRPFQFNRSYHFIHKYWTENRSEILTTAILAVFVFILVMFQVILENRNLHRQIAEIDRQITSVFKQTFPEVTRIVDPVAQMRAGIDRIKNQNVLAGETGVDIRNIDILKDISQLIPANTDIVITRFVRGDNSVQIAGLTDTFNEVDDIKMQLEKSALFSQITISSANMDKSSNRVRFRIRIDLAGMEP